MTATAPTTPAGPTLPAPVAELRAYADRLAQVDMWADTARIRAALLDDDTSADDRLESAWASFRSGQFDQAAATLSQVPPTSPLVQVLTEALAAARGDLGAYHRLIARVEDNELVEELALRIALAPAIENDDHVTAARVAKRLVESVPSDAQAWTVIAAEKAAAGDPVTALTAIEKARGDRFDCQADPAADVLTMLDERGLHAAASILAAHGAVAETGTRPGWVGWRGLLTARHPRTIGLSDAPYAGAGAFVAAAGATAMASGHPWAILFDAAAAGVFLAAVRSRPIGGLPVAAARLVRAAHGRRSKIGPSLGTRIRARFDPFTALARPGLDPGVCSCWEVTCLSGPSAKTYLSNHLGTKWFSDDLALGLAVCPVGKQEWIIVPGFAIRAPSGDDQSVNAPTAPVTTPEDGVKTGQYL